MEGPCKTNKERERIGEQSDYQESDECLEEDEAATGAPVQRQPAEAPGQASALRPHCLHGEEPHPAQGKESPTIFHNQANAVEAQIAQVQICEWTRSGVLREVEEHRQGRPGVTVQQQGGDLAISE